MSGSWLSATTSVFFWAAAGATDTSRPARPSISHETVRILRMVFSSRVRQYPLGARTIVSC